jgi:hypothetical protein
MCMDSDSGETAIFTGCELAMAPILKLRIRHKEAEGAKAGSSRSEPLGSEPHLK